ncbi:hypothetical protein GCM10008967_20800 [Bacillus carboniphilus]|uniref:Uncharacterized protein n=1 Tax=Bacillus carboniphilus TaxID=86663 RepID=A0ABN0W9R9_9BACI
MVLYTFLAGITYLLEYVILVFFNSYVYYPEILKNQYLDSILGSISSNAIAVPMTGTYIGAFRLGWKWVLICTGIIIAIEEWFLHIDIYSHNWWKTYLTAIGLIIFFNIAKRWYSLLLNNNFAWTRYISLYFTCVLIQASLVFFIYTFWGPYHYEVEWFSHNTRDHIAFATAYIFVLSFVLTYLAYHQMKWIWRIVTILLTIPINGILLKIGILHMSKDWSLWHFFFLRVLILAILVGFNNYVFGNSKRNY